MRTTICVLAAAVLAVAAAGPAQARVHQPRNPGTVSFDVTPATVDYGDSVQVSGTISPAADGEHVVVKTTQGDVVASADTDASGSYQTSFAPDRNMTVHAEWGADSSGPQDVNVRAVLTVRLANLRLFGKALVTGTVAPANTGANVDVTLARIGGKSETAHPSMTAAGDFTTRFPIRDPGKYRATAGFADAGHLQGTATSDAKSTPLPGLHIGSHGVSVGLLEERLYSLGYHFFGVNDGYDHRTGDAVMAFRKVQGMARSDTVNAAVWRALAHPKTPRPKDATKLMHLEVDHSKQVMYVVEDRAVRWILHVSTGKPSTPTPFGRFHVMFKRPGMNASGMYYSSYFLQHFAIHGYASVPSYAASHGCVRVPIWHAKWIYGVAKVGTRLLIYA